MLAFWSELPLVMRTYIFMYGVIVLTRLADRKSLPEALGFSIGASFYWTALVLGVRWLIHRGNFWS